MAKTIVLHSISSPVACHLQQQGYKVLDYQQAPPPGHHVDALLFASYRPDSAMFTHSECADITVGICHRSPLGEPLRLNITGQNPKQVLSLLESHLGRHEW